jgi:predicted MFS family arabinose efflux permease
VLAKSNTAYRWVILGTASLSVFAAIGFGRFGYSAVLPEMQEALGLSGAAAGSLASWNLGGYMAMALVGGLLASRFGARLIMSIGIVITAGGMLLTGLSQDLLAASAARLLTGVGNGMVLVPALALMSAWFAPRRLGLASTIVSSGAAVGLVVVGAVVPLILRSGGADSWRLAWYFFAAVGALVAAVTAVVLRNRPLLPAGRPTEAATNVFREFATIVRSAFAWHLAFVYLLYGFAFISFMTFFQRRLVGDLGYSSAVAGYMFLAAGIAAIVFCLAYGMVSDRFGRGRAIASALILEAVAALLFAFRPGTVLLFAAAVIFGSGGFGMPGLVGATCGEHFGPRVAAAALGFVTIFVGIGQATGPYLSGLLADATSSYGPPYLLAAGVFFVSAVAAVFIDGRRQKSMSVDGGVGDQQGAREMIVE